MGRIKHLVERTVETIKNEGISSLKKKTVNYVKLRTVGKTKYDKAYGDVLFINGCTLPHPSRYRVDHQIEQLMSSGVYAEKVFYENLTMDQLKYFRSFVFFRCPITDTVREFIKLAKANNKTVFFDIDDLVIDKKYTDTIDFVSKMNKEDKALYDDGVERMQETLKLCDYAITTTERLQKELLNYTKEVYINRNVASERMVEISKNAYKNRKPHDGIVMGYLSGSITHNPDMELIRPVIAKIMKKYDNVKLKLVGEIDIPEELKEFQDRIIFEPFMDWEKLPKVIASLDINLAPLEESIFNEAKSENKWVEAALVHVVTVASDVGAFQHEIKNGED
ncbi:MAG: glycosyltransferase, partial [Bacilli bacterium]|nr:glycosyltransferase [Bacilli bacterium]